jgi:hypothetical protein
LKKAIGIAEGQGFDSFVEIVFKSFQLFDSEIESFHDILMDLL